MRTWTFIALLVAVFPAAVVRAEDPEASWLIELSDQRGGPVDLLGLPQLDALDEASSIAPNIAPESTAHVNPSPANPAPVQHSFATIDPGTKGLVQSIPVYESDYHSHRLVRYDVPLEDHQTQQQFARRGIEGRLINVPVQEDRSDSTGEALKRFLNPMSAREEQKTVRMVRYEVPAEDIPFHSQMVALEGEIVEPGMLRLPEVRFFQPKARIFTDLKNSNEDEFDLFSDGAILASLDVVELYFPMPLFSERFAQAFGKSSRLSSLGWRVGGTIGVGIATALNNGSSDNGSAPVSTLAAGIRYEFPLGRPSREVLESGDARLDERTRVGIEGGVQGGFSTRESIEDRTDFGMYFGILVNTPWGS